MNLPSTPSHTRQCFSEVDVDLNVYLLSRVLDDYSQNNYGMTESRDGYITQGEYFVNLPDGRLQKVRFLLIRPDISKPVPLLGNLLSRWGCRLCGGRCLHRRTSIPSRACWRLHEQKIELLIISISLLRNISLLTITVCLSDQ